MAVTPGKNSNSYEDVSILSQGVSIEGKINSEGNVRIDGIVNGNITVKGNLTLGETSKITGEIRSRNLTISGKLDGTAQVSEKLVLESKSSVKGDIISKILVIEAGAKFDGRSVMSQATQEIKEHSIYENSRK